ncbi:hypothetical protein [Alicyclobacillus fodiniaquatilis]|jgi:hypothetical protein|uniref:Dolichyl-phosphate-mannose-protein mannosyltransferase n=1 Tax=Alicyclobacillus fodiniaquatilis TaxID=1661150 RepID=A0ABW4JP33_9BACL
MTTVLWILAAMFNLWSAYLFTKRFGFHDGKDRAVTFTLLFVTQIITSVFIAGACIEHLTNLTLFGVDVLFWLISAALVYRQGERLLPSVRQFKWPVRGWHWSGIVFGLMLVIFLAFCAYMGHVLPPYSYDALGYHLVSVATWMHEHRIVDIQASLWANVYPKNAELLYTWLYMSVDSDHWIHLGQWLFGIVGVIATMASARVIGLSRSGAIISGALFFTAPTVILQATTDYNDLAFCAMFLIFFYGYLKFMGSRDWRYMLLSGMAGGITLGIKSDAVMYIAVCFIVMLVQFARFYRKHQVTAKQIVGCLCLLVFPILLFGSEWYIHTWIIYGNPVYPFTVSIAGHVLFAGRGSVAQLIINPNTPSQLLHKPWWQQVWISWTRIPTNYSYDMHIGGFGVIWTFIEWPALVVTFFYALVKDKKLCYQVMVPLIVMFILQPANWWGRYTLFMIPLGAWSFVYICARLRQKWLWTTLYSLVLVIVCGSYGVGAALFAKMDTQHASQVVQAVHNAFATPPQARTVGSVVYPEYHWVDALKGPTNIGMADDVPFPYPLFGDHAKNNVYKFQMQSRATFLHEVQVEDIRYIMTVKGDPYDKWARQDHRRFAPYSQSAGYDVFRVRSSS